MCRDMVWWRTALWSAVASQISSGHFATRATFAELYSMRDYDKVAESFVANYPQPWVGRTIFVIDCRPFRNPDYDETFRRDVGFHPCIIRSVMDADEYGETNRDVCGKLDRIMKGGSMFIIICKSGRHRSVSNEELWSRTMVRCGREFHSVSTASLSSCFIGEPLVKAHAQSAAVTKLANFELHQWLSHMSKRFGTLPPFTTSSPHSRIQSHISNQRVLPRCHTIWPNFNFGNCDFKCWQSERRERGMRQCSAIESQAMIAKSRGSSKCVQECSRRGPSNGWELFVTLFGLWRISFARAETRTQ